MFSATGLPARSLSEQWLWKWEKEWNPLSVKSSLSCLSMWPPLVPLPAPLSLTSNPSFNTQVPAVSFSRKCSLSTSRLSHMTPVLLPL